MRKLILWIAAFAFLGALECATLHAQSKEAPPAGKTEAPKTEPFKPEQQESKGRSVITLFFEVQKIG